MVWDFNSDWKFCLGDGEPTEKVSLPHSPREEELLCDRPYTGLCRYKKTFRAEPEWADKRVNIGFGAAMHTATVLVNGTKVMVHKGGYLPFSVDVERHLSFGADNVVEVLLDNRETSDIPPGKPIKTLDFLYYGGLYRGATFAVTDKVYVSDPIAADIVGGGGVVVSSKDVSEAAATVLVSVFVANKNDCDKKVSLAIGIVGETKLEQRVEAVVSAHSVGTKITAQFLLKTPNLWSPETPFLYRLDIGIFEGSRLLSTHTESFGVRSLAATPEGLFLNGKPFVPYGTNRHQQHPYVGLASSDEAERREARLLKDAGYNTLRLAHYPQSPAFLDECARVGLFVIDCAPGWQFCKRGQFRRILLQNVRDMVRRDRNNPAVLCYETSLNETPFYFRGASDRFFLKLCRTAKEEQPDCLVSGDLLGRRCPRLTRYDIPYPLNYDNGEAKKVVPNRTLVREYGDWGFGGNESTSRVRRGDGDRAQQLQAWNFQWAHNKNMADKNNLGDLYWEGIDHIRGYYSKQPMSCSGALDIFRLPKFSYHMFRSQKKVSEGAEPMVFAAVTNLEAANDLIIYTNTQEVEVLADGVNLGRFRPDCGPLAVYVKSAADKTDVAYWLNGGDYTASTVPDNPLAKHMMTCFHDGGNCENMTCPPVTIPSFAAKNSLVVNGYIDGLRVASHSVVRSGQAARLTIEVADRGIPLVKNGVDFVYCYVTLKDEVGNIVYADGVSVHLTVLGGKVIENDRLTERGIVAFVLRGTAEKIEITASAEGLSGKLSL